ncbi:MAG: 30S ribosomal protein S2 [Acidimicrobiia bacterium]|nr:30S ribosomal protein S2 [Acidimicrobiia bacterium]
MPAVTMRQLLEAGVHFGHQTRRWNPKMSPYIFGDRNGIHIIDLRQTIEQAERAYDMVRDLTAKGGKVLFVGTKKQAQAVVRESAEKADMPYVNNRWLGGMLTNFNTIHKRILYLEELGRMETSGEIEALPKKERLKLRREWTKLDAVLGGVRDMHSVPDAVFVIDVKTEEIAVKEAKRVDSTIIAIVDTNCDPDAVDVVIPGNDDAIRAAELMANMIAEACIEGAALAAAAAKDKADAAAAAAKEAATKEAEAEAAAKAKEKAAAEAPVAAEDTAAPAEEAAPEGESK